MIPILKLSETTTITAVLADAVSNSVFAGLNDGRILRIENLRTNMAMTGQRSLYGQILDGFGNLSDPGWMDAVYRIHNEVLLVNQDKEQAVSFSAVVPASANTRQTIDAVFTTPPLWGGSDFGWWENLTWSAAVPIGTSVMISAKSGVSDKDVAAQPWKSFETTPGSNAISLGAIGNSPWLQLQATLRTSVANLGPSVTSLQATYRTKNSVFFFTKKFKFDRATNLSSGIITAQAITPRFTEVKFGVSGTNSSNWNDYQPISLDKIFPLASATEDRIKVGIKMINYKTGIVPEVDGFALMVGGEELNKLNL